MSDKPTRRTFLKAAPAAALGAGRWSVGRADTPSESENHGQPRTAPPLDVIRVGIVGVGGRGSAHVRNLLRIKAVEIRAICDIVEPRVARMQQRVKDAGQGEPAGYSRGETDFKRMCDRDDIDLVLTATPWQWHVPVCVAAMQRGKHAATEVPAAVTVDECWQLVETSEATRKHCVMLENCCYGRAELAVLNMVRQGVLGELLHGEAGYMHDVRGSTIRGDGDLPWHTVESIRRNGNLYPTHGLGPLAQCMNINRGDRFDYLVSMSTKSRGLNLLAAKRLGAKHPMATRKYAQGDVNSSLIRTADGLTIVLQYDCNTPRPYSRINLVQGAKGIFRGYPDRIYIEGKSPESHAWEPLEGYFQQYDHPLWKALGSEAVVGAGHGGMDYVMTYRLMQTLHQGAAPDMDVYDAADWSVISALSESSVRQKSKPIDFPDFTRGAWKTRKPLGIVAG